MDSFASLPSESPEKEEKVVGGVPPTFSLLCIDMAKPDLHHASGHEMSIFTRTCDFLTWLLPATNHFPRAHPHTFTRRLLDAAL